MEDVSRDLVVGMIVGTDDVEVLLWLLFAPGLDLPVAQWN